ncbi:MAG: nucleotidyl transferase AbiEii/AbiGii toxin family protein [Prolixibacteraceae bacterium]|nr:nucleotidyl transferase AbiEii/AbiGii toxin family protein [Prolixibacteraceae bacterium]
MISEKCTSNSWIEASAKNNKADKILVQKLIRALMLLEGLKESGLGFAFKGGTALMLLLNSAKRLSIDIDIIVPDKTIEIDSILNEIAIKKGFTRVKPIPRKTQTGIEKAHYEFIFPCSLRANNEDYLLLDILFEKIHYSSLISTPINSSFITLDGEPLDVKTPDFNNIMGDKLTAFAPNTTGIPYFKKEKSMGQEIMKQLYDIGNIFDRIDDVSIVKQVFFDFAQVELGYRKLGNDVDLVMDDIVETCLSISLRTPVGKAKFEVLQLGIRQVASYIFSENYYIEKATVHAARTAYLIALFKTNSTLQRYDNKIDMTKWQIEQPNNTKLNKLKKLNPEAFYYWFQYFSLQA